MEVLGIYRIRFTEHSIDAPSVKLAWRYRLRHRGRLRTEEELVKRYIEIIVIIKRKRLYKNFNSLLI